MKGQDKLQRGYEVFRGGVLGKGRPGVGVQGKVGGGGAVSAGILFNIIY